jgi:tetratricopeptide (TPR) repeat protein
MMRRRALTGLLLAFFLASSCATLGRFKPGYDSFDRGVALFNQGHFAEAVPLFERATRENPDFGEAYLYLGRAYVSQSNGARRFRRCVQRSGSRHGMRSRKS